MKRLAITIVLIISTITTINAQHVVGAFGGYGSASFRVYPAMESRSIWNRFDGGLSWRYYGERNYLGCLGIDAMLLQRGFAVAPYGVGEYEEWELEYYTRRLNSIMVPIIWQPYIYIANNRARIFVEAAATFSYDLSSSYENEVAQNAGKDDWQGKYDFKIARDSRFGYGLMGGVGFSLLFDRVEITARGRYFYGYSDVVRERTKYVNNQNDGSENPFWATPLRSQLDNIAIDIGVSYRIGKDGFSVWSQKKVQRDKISDGFNFKEATNVGKGFQF